MLDIKDLNAFYGKSHILRGVNLNIEKGEIVSLLGRNGVGRSTLVKAIMGLVQPQGSIKFLGEEISGMPSHCLLYTSPSPRDKRQSRMPSSA